MTPVTDPRNVEIPADNVIEAFELLLEELSLALVNTREKAAGSVRAGDYNTSQVLVETAQNIESSVKIINELHENWDLRSFEVFGDKESGKEPKNGLAISIKYNPAKATGQYNDGRVVVLKGSAILKEAHPSLPIGTKALRAKLTREGILVQGNSDAIRVLEKDWIFSSPSAAANFVAGYSVSGNRDWKITETGMSLGNWKKKK